MGFWLLVFACILFFLGGVGATVIPNPMIWGLFCMALGMLAGSSWPTFNKSQ